MNRKYSRVAALAIFVCLTFSPDATAKAARDRDAIGGPGERVVRVVKKVKDFFRGFTSDNDGWVPPVPNKP